MEGVEGVMSAEGVHTISGQSGAQAASGALAVNRQQVAKALGSTGFVYVVGQLRQNFETYLDRKPFEIEVSDLKPGTLPELITWVADKLSADPDRAEQAQANVRPEMAMKLLT
jgi:hypothetical protein